MRRLLAPVLVPAVMLAAGCDPQNAQLSAAEYTAWLSSTSSVTLRKGLPLDEFDRSNTIDCRDLPADERLSDPEPLEGAGCGPNGINTRNPRIQEKWLTQDGFVVLGMDAPEAWRGEAVLTSEGDAQLGFHFPLPGGRDFRFQVVVDPDFQPRSCQLNAAGDEIEYAPVDGDWVAEWSKDVDGTLFFLNGGALQFDPSTFVDRGTTPPQGYSGPRQWQLPNEWGAAFGQGRFADDFFNIRQTNYIEPQGYGFVGNDFATSFPLSEDHFYGCPDLPEGVSRGALCDVNGPDYDERHCECLSAYRCPGLPTGVTAEQACDEGGPDYDGLVCGCIESGNVLTDAAQVSHVLGIQKQVRKELFAYGIPADSEGLPSAVPIVHSNLWRPADKRPVGVDGWQELNYSWIRFDASSSFEPGQPASGEFNVFFDGVSSQSRFHVRGRFEVSGWNDDFWTTDYLPPIKFEENGSTLCGSTDIP